MIGQLVVGGEGKRGLHVDRNNGVLGNPERLVTERFDQARSLGEVAAVGGGGEQKSYIHTILPLVAK